MMAASKSRNRSDGSKIASELTDAYDDYAPNGMHIVIKLAGSQAARIGSKTIPRMISTESCAPTCAASFSA